MNFWKPLEASILVLCGFLIGMFAFGDMPSFLPNPDWWSAIAAVLMVPTTIALVWVAAHLPEKFRSRTAQIETMRFTRAVAAEYVNTRHDLEQLLEAIHQKNKDKIDCASIRMSNLYEATRSDAARYSSFTALEAMRKIAMDGHYIAEKAKENAARYLRTTEDTNELASLHHSLELVVNSFTSMSLQVWGRYVQPLLGSDN